MGEAKRRRAEIEALKRLGPRIDVTSRDPEPTVIMARNLYKMIEAAKQHGNVDPPLNFLREKLDATVRSFGTLPIACKRGCSHCCYIWVSATAPELLSIAREIKLRGAGAIERVRIAHEATGGFDFQTRPERPNACPMLEDDLCTIYNVSRMHVVLQHLPMLKYALAPITM